MSKIGLMGGTFDPVHYGHTGLALNAYKELNLSKVIMIPAYIQPFKRDKAVTSDEHRVEMLKLALTAEEVGYDESPFEISTWEIEKGGVSYTYDTLTYFNDLYQNDHICFIMGSDSLMKVENWFKGKELLRNFDFAVGLRQEDKEEEIIAHADYLEKTYGRTITLISNKMLPFSSTMVRERLEEGKSISGMVAPEVENYIYENKLYEA